VITPRIKPSGFHHYVIKFGNMCDKTSYKLLKTTWP